MSRGTSCSPADFRKKHSAWFSPPARDRKRSTLKTTTILSLETHSPEPAAPAFDERDLFPRAHARDRLVNSIFTMAAPYVDRLSRGFSLGLDRYWRQKAVSLSGVGPGNRVLDICAGTGELSFILSRTVGPQGSVIGTDFCRSMLAIAEKKAQAGFANLSFLLADAKSLPFPDASFDAVTVSFGMRNIPDTILALREIRRVLKPGGTFLCLELTKPLSPLVRVAYSWYVFRFMPFVSGFFIKSRAPYQYLPRSIEAFYQPVEFCGVVARSGFVRVRSTSLTLGLATVYRAFKQR